MNDDPDKPETVNLVEPKQLMTMRTEKGSFVVDMRRFAERAAQLGAGKLDVLSIDAHRNAKGELVADYDSIRIEKRAP